MNSASVMTAFKRVFSHQGHNYTIPALIVLGLVVSFIVKGLTPEDYSFPVWVIEMFPVVDWINAAEKWLAENVKWFTLAVAGAVKTMMKSLETFFRAQPWQIMVLIFTLISFAFGGLRVAILTLIGCYFWLAFKGMWKPAIQTLTMMTVSVALSMAIGFTIGILCSQSDRLEKAVRPVLDTMQTMPAFVYFLPSIFFFGIGGASAVMAIVIYALPPMVRLTNLGIRQVPETMIESARSFGSTRTQTLFKVQIPQAKKSIMMGVNQTIMMALGLAVLAAFLGAPGLGSQVWVALTKLRVGWSLEGGLCIVFMAIVFDRISLAMSEEKGNQLGNKNDLQFKLLPQKWVHFKPAFAIEWVINAIWDSISKVGNALTKVTAKAVGAIVSLFNKNMATQIMAWMFRHSFFVVAVMLIASAYIVDAWIWEFEKWPREWRLSIRKPVDEAIKTLTTNESFIFVTKGIKDSVYLYLIHPLDSFLVGLPWWYVVLAFFIICWLSGSTTLAVVTVCALLFTAVAGLWAITIYTLAATLISALICIVIGLPLGILAAYNKTYDMIQRPILDVMQTMPAFVYLVPFLFFFGGNSVTAVLATIVYSLPPMIRMTTLGLQQLPPTIEEVSSSFGSKTLQTLIKVKLPMASPSIMLGVNQAVIMALAMQAITPLIGGLGLGKEVFTAFAKANTGMGLVAGAGIVLLAVVLDRLTQAWTMNQRKALGLS